MIHAVSDNTKSTFFYVVVLAIMLCIFVGCVSAVDALKETEKKTPTIQITKYAIHDINDIKYIYLVKSYKTLKIAAYHASTVPVYDLSIFTVLPVGANLPKPIRDDLDMADTVEEIEPTEVQMKQIHQLVKRWD